jgi:uncharacterized protein (TIGR02284 family)
MAQKQEFISTINNLIETLKDGQEGYRQAAEAVKDPQLKSLFNGYSEQRARFARELQTEARQLGEDEPEKTSSAAGAAHRAWINIKSVATSGDDAAILAECERGEDSAVNEFTEALEERLPDSLQQVVTRQFNEVKSAHDRIKNLRDMAKKI